MISRNGKFYKQKQKFEIFSKNLSTKIVFIALLSLDYHIEM